jgi:hypothetical protein
MDALDGGDTWLLKKGLKLTGYADKLPDPSIGGWPEWPACFLLGLSASSCSPLLPLPAAAVVAAGVLHPYLISHHLLLQV